jgi:hypothetical protein
VKEDNKFNNFSSALLALGLLYAVISVNTLATAAAFIALFAIIKLTWQKVEMPLLFIAMVTQFLAITVKVFYANYNQLKFDDYNLHRYPENISEAYYWALAGLVALSAGIYVVTRRFSYDLADNIPKLSLEFDSKKLRTLYIIMAIAYPIVYKLSFSLGGLQQPISKLIEFKWSIFLIFLLNSFYSKNIKSFLIIFIIELLFSFTGFFSAFKDYFIILFVGLITIYGSNLKLSSLLPISAALGVGLYILVVWQYIKPQYRTFLNEGQNAQVSVRDASESLEMLYDLANEIDEEGINDGFERTVDRLSYIDFLSATINNVPANVAHTNGELWTGAIERTLKPRILFPDKSIIDDSEKTRLYTGDQYMGSDRGVSISLGYFAESYVDFGKIGMLVVLFCFGTLIGSIYKFVLSKSPNILIGIALAVPLFFVIYNYEKALDKIFGALLMYFLAFLVIKAFLVKRAVAYLNSGKTN